MKRLILLAAGLLSCAGLVLSAAPASASHVPSPHKRAHVLKVRELPDGLLAIPAITANNSPAYNICLRNNSNYCWMMNGNGAQVTITNNVLDQANMVLIGYTQGGTQYLKFQDGNGHCVYLDVTSGASHALLTGANGCSADFTNSTQAFISGDSDSAYDIQSAYSGGPLGAYGDIMTFNDVNGKPVWINFENGWAQWLCVNAQEYIC